MRRILVVVAVVATTLPLTTSVQAQTVTVAAAGDIARPSFGTPQQKTADLVTAFNPTAVFGLGDLQYENGELANFQTYYDASWGAFKSKTYPIPGNHEYLTPGASGYFTYFGSRAGDPRKGFYSFNLGNWHVVALNTNCHEVNCTAQKRWMANDLAADAHTCELAMFHHTNNTWARRKLAAAGGDIALGASRHVYERWAREGGVVRFTVGTGGRSLGNTDPAAAASFHGYGILQLTLNRSSYAWSFVDVDGKVRDSGSRNCH